ncbi:Transposase IS204/IS1001/IS1096/IS1165 family protein OS=Methylobacterium extorquens (strain CM4 / NCIMB 13688) GN=Mchl_4809 PE=4 SV=1: zf-ISL3 [Gemmata massiliana]|uniref:Transposase IS204/IS1001/IS1096/IS1165 zinc-finger domain-containing protein n=1 Tax=Gemmata massiliana TaxID=1210884 RepID=A0A6P2CW39_9BACT|nr:Transposase IS204/IS1001/IS1096/IS1165 family protein OS=Methylobacterium extorquens (strain CM4 / NCIMB 13688) GN=Mchl_4809 PE=4 SV=1: zf-ISL3 [Gemmata massiliana]
MSACDLNLDFPGVILTDVYLTPTLAVVVLVSTAAESSCPSCHNPSARVHSRYVRTLADLPGHNRPVALRLTVRRFFCSQAPRVAARAAGERY